MQQALHPKYGPVTITCLACGNVIKTLGTKDDLKTELCSNCHPFYTGKQVLVDTAGQVDRFKKRMEAAQQHQDAQAKKQATQAKKKDPEQSNKEVETMSNEELLGKIKQQLADKEAAKAKKNKPSKAAAKKDA